MKKFEIWCDEFSPLIDPFGFDPNDCERTRYVCDSLKEVHKVIKQFREEFYGDYFVLFYGHKIRPFSRKSPSEQIADDLWKAVEHIGELTDPSK